MHFRELLHNAQILGGDFVFFDNFQRLCKEHGTKPTPVIVALGLSKGNIGRWKEGVIPSGDILVKIANYLNVSVDELLGAEKEKAPAPPVDGENAKYNELMSLLDRMDDKSLSRFIELAHLASLPDEDFDRAIAILRLAIPGEQS